jgi:hypothetical protein
VYRRGQDLTDGLQLRSLEHRVGTGPGVAQGAQFPSCGDAIVRAGAARTVI